MKYRRAEPFVDTRVDGELIAFDVNAGFYHHFNATGTAIWDLLDKPLSRDELLHGLAKRFEIDPAQIAGETDAFLHNLVEKRIIVAEDDSGA